MFDLPLEYALIKFEDAKPYRQDRPRAAGSGERAASCAL